MLREFATRAERRIGGLRDEYSPVFCPDHRALIFNSNRLGGRFDLWLQPIGLDGSLGAPRRVTDQTGSVSHPTCSPDGGSVAYHRVHAGQRDIWVAPIDGGSARQFTSDPAADIHADWSPDGSRLAFASERGGGFHIWAQPVAIGAKAGSAWQVTFGPREDTAPAWSPDGTAIAFIGETSEEGLDAWVVPADGVSAARRVTRRAGAERVRWDRSTGHLIVTGMWGSTKITPRRFRVVDGTEGEPISDVLLTRSFPDFDVSADGNWLAFNREERRGDLWLLEAQVGSY